MADCCLKYLDVGTGVGARSIAARVRAGAAPGLLWLGGFKSDMQGTKAQALDQWANDHSRAMVRFDYSGHGESGGASPRARSAAGWRRAWQYSAPFAVARRW